MWTESRQPAGSGQRPTDEKEQSATGIIIAGYAFAVLMPIVGFVIGLTQINRNRHGVWVVVVAAVAFAIWVGILSADQNAYR
jgi:VIT1/CCC1 family predicted Fe2+/Mn2+ transporter